MTRRTPLRLASLLACMYAAAFSGCANTESPHPRATDAATSPEYCKVVAQDTADRGRTPIGGVAVRTTTFKNVSSQAVTVRVTKRTCSCVDDLVTPARVEPGATCEVELRAHVISTDGTPQRHAALVEIAPIGGGDAQGMEIEVRFQPDIDFSVKPTELFIWAPVGEPVSASLYLRAGAAGLPEVDTVSSDIPGVSVASVQRGEAMEQFRVRVQAPFADDPRVGSISVRFKDGKWPAATVPLTVSSIPAYRIDGPPLILKPGERRECTLLPSRPGVPGVAAVDVEGDDGIDASLAGGGSTLMVHADRSMDAGSAVVYLLGPDGERLAALSVACWPG